MAKMEKWEAKAIGRTPRYQDYNGVMDSVMSGAINVGSAATNFLIDRALFGVVMGSDTIKNCIEVKLTDQKLKGKRFKIGNEFSDRMVGKALSAGVGKANQLIVNKLIGKDFVNFDRIRRASPAHAFVANHVFNDFFAFDEQKRLHMENACGYAPDCKQLVKQLHDELSALTGKYSDVTWRKEAMPHLLKVTYEQELNKALVSIQKRYESNESLFSRGMMRVTMRKAAQQLGELFEDYSLKIANGTDYLEAPLSILPKKKPAAPQDFTAAEKVNWKQVKQASLLESQKALDTRINLAMTPYKLTVARVQDIVAQNATRPVTENGVQKRYVVGENAQEDHERYRHSVATVRDLKRVYENRNFLRKWLTPSGRNQRNAIAQLSTQLTSYGKSEAEVARHLNLKTDPGKEFSDVNLLRIQQKAYVFPDPPKSAAALVKEAALSVAGAVYDFSWSTGKAAMNMITSSFSNWGSGYHVGASANNTVAKEADAKIPDAKVPEANVVQVKEVPVAVEIPQANVAKEPVAVPLDAIKLPVDDSVKAIKVDAPQVSEQEHAPKPEAGVADERNPLGKELAEAARLAEATAAKNDGFFSSLYNYMPLRSYTPAEILLQTINEKEQVAINGIINADKNSKEFYSDAAEFLYYKIFQNVVKSNFTQESCDMLAEKFLDRGTVGQGIAAIQKSPAFQTAVIAPHMEQQSKNEPFQALLDPNNTASPGLMKMYHTFVAESAKQMPKDSSKVQVKEAMNKPKAKEPPKPGR